MIRIPEHIKNLTPYKSGKPIDELAREKGLTKIVKLASNENPLGPSPKAVEAIQKHLQDLHRYTDPTCYRLIHKLAEKTGLPVQHIFAASGSDAILEYIISAFTCENDEIISSEGTFIGWQVNGYKMNRKVVRIPLLNFAYNLNAMADAVTPATRIIYLANPNNPTGIMFTKAEFESFLNRVPDDVLIVYDEAYYLYANQHADYPAGMKHLRDNVIVTRTFSKSYGLAGLRLGIAFGHPELISMMFKVRLPFEPNALAQEAAIAALDDDDFLERTIELNKTSMKMIFSKLDELGITFTHSSTNFTMMLLPGDEYAMRFHEECLNRGLILRYLNSFGIHNGIRINSGTMEETEFALNVISQVHTKLQEGILIK